MSWSGLTAGLPEGLPEGLPRCGQHRSPRRCSPRYNSNKPPRGRRNFRVAPKNWAKKSWTKYVLIEFLLIAPTT